LAAVSAAVWAAKGVDLREPRKPSPPALAQERAFAVHVGNGYDGVVEAGLNMSRTAFNILAFAAAAGGWSFPVALAMLVSSLPFTFSVAMVFLGPLRVRAFVLVRCPRTGRPLR
jgi:hypothetical protein